MDEAQEQEALFKMHVPFMMCAAITHYVANVYLLGMHAYISMIHETSPDDFCIF